MTCDLTASLSVPSVEQELEIGELPVIGKGRCVLLLWKVLFWKKCDVFEGFVGRCFSCFIVNAFFLLVLIYKILKNTVEF